MLGKKHSEETKQKIREINLENPQLGMLGKHHSNESKIKMSEAQMWYKDATKSTEYCGAWSDREYKEDVRKTACEKCGITHMLSLKLFGGILVIHHVDEDKQNCKPSNLLTACKSCHMKIHWEARRNLRDATF